MSRYEPLLEYNNINGIEQWKINDISVSKERYEEAVKKQNKRINDITPEEWDAAAHATGWGVPSKASEKQDWYVETKDIPNYEGLYAVSKVGEVISWGNKSNHKEPIVLSPSTDKEGYKRVTLQKDGKKEYYRICRLVASAFCENPFEYDNVNHIDKDKANDNWLNLEWVSVYQNWKHSEEEQMYKEMPVIKLSLDGDYICEYKSLMDAARDTGINQGNITNCLKGRCKTVGGYRWIQK